jgi:hypothetical protein
MSQTADFYASPSFLQYVSQQCFVGKNLRLGVITNAAFISGPPPLNEATVIAAEYNSGGWTRPNLVVPSVGSFDSAVPEWDIGSTTQEWVIVGPSGGFDIRQLFVMIDGTSTPRNTTGTFLGPLTYPTAISVAAGASLPIRAPWSIRGVA